MPQLMLRYPWITPWNVYDIPFDLLVRLADETNE